MVSNMSGNPSEQWFQVDQVDHHQITYYWTVLLILDHSYLVGKLTGLKIADTSVRILKVLLLLFQQFLNLSSFHQGISGPILEALSNNR
jgi:hypothetical protein